MKGRLTFNLWELVLLLTISIRLEICLDICIWVVVRVAIFAPHVSLIGSGTINQTGTNSEGMIYHCLG